MAKHESKPKSSPRSHLRHPPIVSSSSFCCPRRRPPPLPPRPNLSVSATADAIADDLSLARETPAYLWRKDHKWHPVSYPGFSPSTATAAQFAAQSSRPIFSSDDDDDDDNDTIVSSTADNSFEMTELRARRAAMMDGGEGLAVVKRSEDPRADFRRSMAEMVVEKGIIEAGELEQLLQCFLSLNSQHHHQAIVDAFEDVWVALFPATPFGGSPRRGRPAAVAGGGGD